MAGSPVRETENLVSWSKPMDAGTNLRHDACEIASLAGGECCRPYRVKHSLPNFRLTRIDGCCLDLYQHFSVSGFGHRHVYYLQDVTSTVFVKSHRLHFYPPWEFI